MPDYDAMRATAASLINRFGSARQATITKRIPGAYDPITDTDPGETTANYTVDCTVVPLSETDMSVNIDDLTISEAVKVLFPSNGLIAAARPLPGDQLTLPGRAQPFFVKYVKPMAPDGDHIVFTVIADIRPTV